MPGNFFDGEFFGGGFFGLNASASVRGGGGDNKRKKTLHLPVKPTGLLDRPKKKQPEGRKDVEQRVAETREIQAEVYGQLAKELRAEREKPVIQEMSLREVEAEIGELLRKKLRTEDEEIMLLLLVAAAG